MSLLCKKGRAPVAALSLTLNDGVTASRAAPAHHQHSRLRRSRHNDLARCSLRLAVHGRLAGSGGIGHLLTLRRRRRVVLRLSLHLHGLSLSRHGRIVLRLSLLSILLRLRSILLRLLRLVILRLRLLAGVAIGGARLRCILRRVRLRLLLLLRRGHGCKGNLCVSKMRQQSE